MKVVTQPGGVHCGECGTLMTFERSKLIEENPTAVGYCDLTDSYSAITGELIRKGCSRAGKRLIFPLTIIDCEEV